MNRVLGNLFGRIFLTLRSRSIPRLGQKAHAQLKFSPFPTGLHVCVEACYPGHRVVAHRLPRFLGHQGFTQTIGMRQGPCLRPGQALPNRIPESEYRTLLTRRPFGSQPISTTDWLFCDSSAAAKISWVATASCGVAHPNRPSKRPSRSAK